MILQCEFDELEEDTEAAYTVSFNGADTLTDLKAAKRARRIRNFCWRSN